MLQGQGIGYWYWVLVGWMDRFLLPIADFFPPNRRVDFYCRFLPAKSTSRRSRTPIYAYLSLSLATPKTPVYLVNRQRYLYQTETITITINHYLISQQTCGKCSFISLLFYYGAQVRRLKRSSQPIVRT